jgi:hypothetical protein
VESDKTFSHDNAERLYIIDNVGSTDGVCPRTQDKVVGVLQCNIPDLPHIVNLCPGCTTPHERACLTDGTGSPDVHPRRLVSGNCFLRLR